MSSKPQYLYLIKVSVNDNHLSVCNGVNDYVFYDKDYRKNHIGLNTTIFHTWKKAVNAILNEKRMLKHEYVQYRDDLDIILRHKLNKRYEGIVTFLRHKTNYWALIHKQLTFKVVKVELAKVEEIISDTLYNIQK